MSFKKREKHSGSKQEWSLLLPNIKQAIAKDMKAPVISGRVNQKLPNKLVVSNGCLGFSDERLCSDVMIGLLLVQVLQKLRR